MKKYVLGPNAARKLKELIRGSGEMSRRGNLSTGLAFGSEYVAPFTVQWAQSANDGSGAWIIWLPSDSLLHVSGDRIDVSADLEPVGVDYPEGWFALTNDMINADTGGVLYLNVRKSGSEGLAEIKAAFSSEDGYRQNGSDAASEDKGDVIASIAICLAAVSASDGSRSVKQFVTSTIVIGSRSASISGDTESSEWINTEGKSILIQGYPGNAGDTDDVNHSGLTFTTVSEREDEGGGKIPAKIIVGIKDKLKTESWAAKTMTVPISGGGTKIVHFLGCDDMDLTKLGGGGGGSSGVVGSEYIDVDQEEDENDPNKTHDVVKAKIATPDAVPSAEDDRHALLTNDTNQLVRAVKTFLGSLTPSASKRVIIDGPNGKVSVVSADGSKKIDLDSEDIPEECGGTLKVHELKFKDKDGNIQIYHVLSCGDIDLTKVGKLIDHTKITLSTKPGGTNTMVFYYTDGSTDTYKILNGINGVGTPGTPGKDGKNGKDGVTPVITANRTGSKQTTIFSNGIPIAVINDGQDGQGGGTPVEQTFISDISFSLSKGKVIANVTKKRGKFIEVVDAGTSNVDVVSGTEVEVVVSSTYSTPNFTNNRKRVTVLKVENGSGQSVFTATPLSQG